jgi:hypothetical protein
MSTETSQKIETYGVALQSMRDWIAELADGRHARSAVLAGTVVLWAVSLDDALLTRRPGYHDARRSARAENLMLGARFARHAVAHGYVVVAAPQGLQYPITYPMDYGPNVWRSARHLTWDRGSGQAKRDAEERAAYEATFERRPIAEPLREVLTWLEHWTAGAAP